MCDNSDNGKTEHQGRNTKADGKGEDDGKVKAEQGIQHQGQHSGGHKHTKTTASGTKIAMQRAATPKNLC